LPIAAGICWWFTSLVKGESEVVGEGD